MREFKSLILSIFLALNFVGGCALTLGNTLQEKAVEMETEARAMSFEWTKSSVNRSLTLYLEAAELWRQLPDTAKQGAALRGASRQKLTLGDSEGAFSLLLTALELEKRSENVSGRVQTLSLLSRVALLLGRYRKCESYYQRAIALTNLTSDPLALGEAYYSASRYQSEKQAVDQIIHFNRQALAQFRLARDKPLESEMLVEQSYAYLMRRDLPTSLLFAQQALNLSEQINDRRGQVNAWIAIGNANITMGESKASIAAYQKADSLAPDDLDHMKKGQIANGLGSLHEKYGDWQQSINYRGKALKFFQAEKNKPGQLYTLIRLGELYYHNGNHETAIAHLDEGEKIARQLNDRFGLASVWIQKGYIGFKINDEDTARNYYRRAARIFKKLNDRLYLALIQNYLGEVEESAGNLNKSGAHYRAALRYDREVKSRFTEAETLYRLARLSYNRNYFDKALQLIEESLQISETLRGNVANTRLRTSYFSEVHDRFEFYINLLMRLHRQSPLDGYDRRALQASENARARTMADTLRSAGVDFLAGAEANLIEREKRVRVELTLKSDELTDLIDGSVIQTDALEKLKIEIDNLSAEYDAIRAMLREQSVKYRTIAEPEVFNLAKFQNLVLDDNSLLIEFSLGKEQSYLWLVSNTEVVSYILPPQHIIEEKVKQISVLLADRDIRIGEELEEYQERLLIAEKQYWKKAQELSNLLLSQAEEKLGNKRLIFVPDKSLHYLSFAALPKPDSAEKQSMNEPLMITHEIVYQPSANTLLLLENKFLETSPTKTLLVFADPIFSRNDLRITRKAIDELDSNESDPDAALQNGTKKNPVLLRLPSTHQEAESISSYLSSTQSTILTGTRASRDNLFHINFSDYKVVHFATHGLYDEKNPELSAVVLSQFDENGNSQNGYLRLNDIYRLSLPVNLVVLSACSSGAGQVVRGEGVVGLTRGFMQTGAKSVLSSLWKVDDAATAELMKKFYEKVLIENLAPSQALRQAQIQMWQDSRWKSPFYWAAFNLHGNFRQPISSFPNQTTKSTYIWLKLFLFLMAVFTFFLLRKLSVHFIK